MSRTVSFVTPREGSIPGDDVLKVQYSSVTFSKDYNVIKT